jgi:AsmA protein
MNRKLRLILIIVGVLVLLLVIAPFLIPVNQFRPTIEDKASAALGRKVQVGNLSLSLVGGSVGAESLSIGDDPKFSQSPFLTAKSVKVGVELLPLIFSKTLNVTGVTIENAEVTLLRNPAGQWNYSSLGGPSAKFESAQTPAPKAPAASSPTEFSVKQLDLKDGRISVGSTSSQKRSVYDHVDVSASDVSLNSKFPVKVTADLPGGGKFKLDGNAGPVDKEDSTLTPVEAKLDVTSLNLASTGLLDPSLGLGGIVDLSASLASNNGEAETKGTAQLSNALLIAGGSPALEPVKVDFNTKYDLRKNTGVLNPSTVKIGNAASHLNGTYERKGEETVVNAKITGDNMPAKDFEAFLPALGIHLPQGASLQAGTLSTNLSITGPTNKLVTSGNVGLFSAKLAGFDLGSKMSSVAALAGVKSGKDLDIEKMTTNLKMAPTGLEADNFQAVLPAVGNLIGGGTIDSKNNLDFKMVATLATSSMVGGAASPVTAGVAGLLGKQGGGRCKSTSIPFVIKGTTADPKFAPDVGGLASSMLKTQLGCAAGAVPAGGLGQSQNSVDAIGGLFSKKKKP